MKDLKTKVEEWKKIGRDKANMDIIRKYKKMQQEKPDELIKCNLTEEYLMEVLGITENEYRSLELRMMFSPEDEDNKDAVKG